MREIFLGDNKSKDFILDEIISHDVMKYVEEYIPFDWRNSKNSYWNGEDQECDLCGFCFSSGQSLKYHRQKQHNLKCDQCEYKTTSKTTMKRHMVDHYSEESEEE